MEEIEVEVEGTVLRHAGKEARQKSDNVDEYCYPPFPKTFPEDFMRKPKDSEIPDKEYGLWYPN
jgi:hypothetical protein